MIYVLTALVPEHGRQVIVACDREPTIEEQWELLREYVKLILGIGMMEEDNTYDEDAVTRYMNNFCGSDFEVNCLEITKLGDQPCTAPTAENQSPPNA